MADSEKQIAIGDRGSKKVRLWASIENTDPDGQIHFFVKNGGWAGTFKGGSVYVEETEQTYGDNVILWRGSAPFYWEEYNEAIPWIEDQIARPITSKITKWLNAIWDLRNYRVKFVRVTPVTNHARGWRDDYDDEIPF